VGLLLKRKLHGWSHSLDYNWLQSLLVDTIRCDDKRSTTRGREGDRGALANALFGVANSAASGSTPPSSSRGLEDCDMRIVVNYFLVTRVEIERILHVRGRDGDGCGSTKSSEAVL